MKAVIYARVSTGLQDFNRQLEDCRKFCKKEEITVVKEFSEKESGTHEERIELSAMMDFIKKHPVDYVVVSEISRLGRTAKVLQTIDELTKLKICLYSDKERLYTLTPEKTINPNAQLLITIMSGINRLELDTLKHRIKSGIKEKRLKGHAPGSLNMAYGYYSENKIQYIHPEESEVIKDIFDMYLNKDLGTRKIAIELNNKNIPTRTKKIHESGKNIKVDKDGKTYTTYNYQTDWIESQIYSILTNPIYKGKRRSNTGKIEGFKSKFSFELIDQPQLKIIEPEIFDLVQTKLSNNVTKAGTHMKHNYLLEPKKIICGCCHKNYFARKLEKETDSNYRCITTRSISSNCGNTAINIDKMNKLVQTIILLNYSDILKQNLEDNTLKEEIKEIQKEIDHLKLDLKKLIKQEDKVIQSYLNEEINKERYLSNLKPVQQEQDNINNNINLLNEKLTITKISYESSMDIAKIKKNFRLNYNLPKTVVNKIVTNITVTKIESAPQEFRDKIKDVLNNHFTNKQDRLILITLLFGVTKLYYLISQRSKEFYDYQNNMVRNPYLMVNYTGSDIRRFNEYIQEDINREKRKLKKATK